jgi:hypothetical protein
MNTVTQPQSSAVPNERQATTTIAPNSAVATSFDARPRRGWAYAGLLGGIGAFIFFLGPASMLTVETESYADNVKVLADLEGKTEWVWAFQTTSFALAMLLVVFGVGLRRRLAGQEPAGSLVPDCALLGLVLMAVMTLVGGGISTEMFHALRNADEADPDTIAGHLSIYNTMAWVWAGGLLTTGAVAIAGLRHGSVGRGLGRFAAVMSGLVIVTQVLPFQYLAVLPMAIFLIVCGISMIRSETGRR